MTLRVQQHPVLRPRQRDRRWRRWTIAPRPSL